MFSPSWSPSISRIAINVDSGLHLPVGIGPVAGDCDHCSKVWRGPKVPSEVNSGQHVDDGVFGDLEVPNAVCP